MKISHLFAIGLITVCTGCAWFILANALQYRTESMDARLSAEVTGNWGGEMSQKHPRVYYQSPNSTRSERRIETAKSLVDVSLEYQPKRKGLLEYRTYGVEFLGEYLVENPTPITQTIYFEFYFPAEDTRYDQFFVSVGGVSSQQPPSGGKLTEAVILGPGDTVTFEVRYRASGINRWVYSFEDESRLQDFELGMVTNFEDINVPMGTESPTSRSVTAAGWDLSWVYSAVIGARAIGMDMPKVLNPGPVATRIAWFAPVSLLFFFSVVVILSLVRGVSLHPMNFFFLAAGCFAFQLLFAYLVDLIPTMVAFAMAAGVSLLLVNGYIWAIAGRSFAALTTLAHFAYMVLFSYSFFFNGITGITITVGAVATLGLLMKFTADTDWAAVFGRSREAGTENPPPMPPSSGDPSMVS